MTETETVNAHQNPRHSARPLTKPRHHSDLPSIDVRTRIQEHKPTRRQRRCAPDRGNSKKAPTNCGKNGMASLKPQICDSRHSHNRIAHKEARCKASKTAEKMARRDTYAGVRCDGRVRCCGPPRHSISLVRPSHPKST